MLAKFLKNYPSVYPSIFSGPSSILCDRIQNGELEFGLFFHLPETPSSLQVAVLKKIRFHIVIRADLKKNVNILHTFIGSREIDDRMTRRFPTIDRMRKDHPQTAIKISSNNLTSHKAMVLQGLGVSVLPEFLVRDEIKSGKLLEFYPKEVSKFTIKLMTRRRDALTQEAKLFVEACRSQTSATQQTDCYELTAHIFYIMKTRFQMSRTNR